MSIVHKVMEKVHLRISEKLMRVERFSPEREPIEFVEEAMKRQLGTFVSQNSNPKIEFVKWHQHGWDRQKVYRAELYLLSPAEAERLISFVVDYTLEEMRELRTEIAERFREGDTE